MALTAWTQKSFIEKEQELRKYFKRNSRTVIVYTPAHEGFSCVISICICLQETFLDPLNYS